MINAQKDMSIWCHIIFLFFHHNTIENLDNNDEGAAEKYNHIIMFNWLIGPTWGADNLSLLLIWYTMETINLIASTSSDPLEKYQGFKVPGEKYNTMDSLYRNNISDHDPYKQQFTFNQGFTHYFQYRQIFYYFWTSHLSAYVRIIFTVTWVYSLPLEFRLLFTYIYLYFLYFWTSTLCPPSRDIKPRL